MRKNSDGTLMHEWNQQTQTERDLFETFGSFFDAGLGTTVSKLENFPKFVRRQSLSKFLARNEIFQKVLNVHGSIIDCGVNAGCSLFTFAQLSTIFEPINYTRRIIGFDTFAGITGISDKDNAPQTSAHVREGGFAAENYDGEIKAASELFDKNRNLGHIQKVEIVKGDIRETLPKYIEDNPHLTVSLLHLDLDVYEPTKVAIQTLLSRMPKGAILLFDQVNQPGYPGETAALLDCFELNKIRLQRFSYETGLSYAVIE